MYDVVVVSDPGTILMVDVPHVPRSHPHDREYRYHSDLQLIHQFHHNYR